MIREMERQNNTANHPILKPRESNSVFCCQTQDIDALTLCWWECKLEGALQRDGAVPKNYICICRFNPTTTKVCVYKVIYCIMPDWQILGITQMPLHKVMGE